MWMPQWNTQIEHVTHLTTHCTLPNTTVHVTNIRHACPKTWSIFIAEPDTCNGTRSYHCKLCSLQRNLVEMSADTLNKSLTPIDWLMTGPRPAANNGHAETKSCSKGPRKPPPVPVDLNAHLDPIDSNHYKYIDEKPSYSYATLIIFAINSSSQRRMTLSQIYEWITSNFTYYKDAHTGWKVSGRIAEL